MIASMTAPLAFPTFNWSPVTAAGNHLRDEADERALVESARSNPEAFAAKAWVIYEQTLADKGGERPEPALEPVCETCVGADQGGEVGSLRRRRRCRGFCSLIINKSCNGR